MRRRSLVLCLVALPVYGLAQETKRRVNVTVGQYSTKVEQAAWTVYGVSLGDWVNKNRIADTAPEGPFVPSFEAELHARQMQLKIWRELNEKATYSLRYMDELQSVETAGFLREYIWQHHRQPNWGVPPSDLRVAAFNEWQAKNLATHVPHTGAQIVFGPKVR